MKDAATVAMSIINGSIGSAFFARDFMPAFCRRYSSPSAARQSSRRSS